MSQTANLERTPAPPKTSGAHHPNGLLLIGLFKLSKSIFFFIVGLGALHLLHKDLGDEAMRVATRTFHFDPEGRVVSFLMNKADLIDTRRLKQIGLGTFAYSALAMAEGIGLMLQKVWAEYLTLSLTVVFLPWEIYELARRPSGGRAVLLLANLAILGYLLRLLQKKRAEESALAK